MKILLFKSLLEAWIVIVGLILFIFRSTQMGFIFFHIVHLFSAGLSIFCFICLKQDFFLDLMAEFPVDKRRHMGLTEFETYLEKGFKDAVKPVMNDKNEKLGFV